jgi:hypothetical protein
MTIEMQLGQPTVEGFDVDFREALNKDPEATNALLIQHAFALSMFYVKLMKDWGECSASGANEDALKVEVQGLTRFIPLLLC